MRKFKELVEQLISLNEYKRGFKSQAAARDVVRSRTLVEPDYDGTPQSTVVVNDYTGKQRLAKERPDKPGSKEPDTKLLQFNREVALSAAKGQRETAKKAARAEGEKKGKEKKQRIAATTKQIAKVETQAKTLGIPDIRDIVDGKMHPQKDVAGISVVGHDKDGYIASHQGRLHFKHPNGKTHNDIELTASANGIGVWRARGAKKSSKPIAYLHPKASAVPVRGGVRSGKIEIHPEDELNR